MLLFGQTGQTETAGGLASLLESAPTDEIMVMFVVFIVFASLLASVITFCVTSTIRAIRITSINANLTERLVKQGVPHEQIERMVSGNRPSRLFPSFGPASRWKRPPGPPAGKPAPLRTTA